MLSFQDTYPSSQVAQMIVLHLRFLGKKSLDDILQYCDSVGINIDIRYPKGSPNFQRGDKLVSLCKHPYKDIPEGTPLLVSSVDLGRTQKYDNNFRMPTVTCTSPSFEGSVIYTIGMVDFF